MSLLVILDKMLRDAGLDFDTAKALLAPGQDDLVIHVHQLLDGAPQPPAGAITSLGITDTEPMAPPENPLDVSTPCGSAVVVDAGGAGGHGGHTLRQTAPGELTYSRDVPTILTTNDEPLLPMDTKPHRLERGASWGEVQATAKAMRITATMGAGSGVVLTDAFGSTVFPDVASARDALNARWSHFNAIGTRLS